MLPRARKSVEDQTYKDFVWVIVNDVGAKDYVEENAKAAEAAGVNVKVVHRESSTGMESASNAGIQSTDCELFVIHDDDDSWAPDFLGSSVAFLDSHPEYVAVTCHSNAVYESIENDHIKVLKTEPYNEHLQSIQLADMVLENSFAPISLLVRREIYDEIGGYDESLPVLGDWDFNLRVLLKGDMGLLPRTLANYHIRETVSKDQIVYGNSITAGMNIHQLQDAKYRNLKIRQDLERGEFGLGHLLFEGRHLHSIKKSISLVGRFVRLPQRAWWRLKNIFRPGSRNS